MKATLRMVPSGTTSIMSYVFQKVKQIIIDICIRKYYINILCKIKI